MTRLRLVGAIILSLSTAALMAAGVGDASAQLDLSPLFPTSTTTTTQPGAPTTTTTNLVDALLAPLVAPTTTTPPPPPTTAASAAAAPPIPGNAGGEGQVPTAEAGPFPSSLAAQMNSVRRSRPNGSDGLVDSLKALTDLGVPPDEAMRVGMGHFPIAGRAHYSHDWWYPRFGPGWRLHEGTDLFAAQGTPVRSPTTGTVTFSDSALGGIAVYVHQSDGTYFYLAHLANRAPGLKPGQTVNVGDIVGFVGTTGNAAGGSPHLHFEVHPATKIVTVGKGKKRTTKAVYTPVRPGTVLPASDPKELLDFYLADALAQLPGVVATYAANQALAAPPTAANAVPTATVDVHSLSVGGLISVDAPIARTPLLGLAMMLMVMVVVLMPVLAPRRRLVGAAALRGGHLAMHPPAHRRRRRRDRNKEAPDVVPALIEEEPPRRRLGQRLRPTASVSGGEPKGRKAKKAAKERAGTGHAGLAVAMAAGGMATGRAPTAPVTPAPHRFTVAGANGATTNGSAPATSATNGSAPAGDTADTSDTADPGTDTAATTAPSRPARGNRVRRNPPDKVPAATP